MAGAQRELYPEDSSITAVLNYCKEHILYPYIKVLGVMGLKPLNTDTPDASIGSTLVNKMYAFLVTLTLLAGYIIQYLSCFRRDRGFTYTNGLDYTGLERMPNNNTLNLSNLNVTYNDTLMLTSSSSSTSTEDMDFHCICEGNPFFIYLVPSVLHFFAFVYMVYLYGVNEDEQLQNLMERVFIQSAHAQTQFFSQKRCIRVLQGLMAFGSIWTLTSVTCSVLQILSHDIHLNIWPDASFETRQGLVWAMTFFTIWHDSVDITIILSYCMHCYLLSVFLDLLHARVRKHSITLPECVKEIGELDKLLCYLNNDLAPGIGPLVLLNGTFAVSGLANLLSRLSSLGVWDIVTTCIMSTLWLIIFLFPIVQAARLTNSCKKVRELGHLVRMRPFGYQEIPQTDLDSFLLFVSTLKLGVRILNVPVSQTLMAFCLTTLTVLLLVWGFFFV